jgi:hypothetical protein
MLLDLKGIGPEFAAILWSEGLCRHFDNRRQVAAYAGLAPTPWQSGSVDREQGVSKAGNPRREKNCQKELDFCSEQSVTGPTSESAKGSFGIPPRRLHRECRHIRPGSWRSREQGFGKWR